MLRPAATVRFWSLIFLLTPISPQMHRQVADPRKKVRAHSPRGGRSSPSAFDHIETPRTAIGRRRPQLRLSDLARRSLGQLVVIGDVAGQLEARETFAAEREYPRGRQLRTTRAVAQPDTDLNLLAAHFVRHRYGGCLDDFGNRLKYRLQFRGGYVFAIAPDNVLEAPQHGEESVGIATEKVARAKPPLFESVGCGRVVPEVSLHHSGASDPKFTGLPIGHITTTFVHHAQPPKRRDEAAAARHP